MAPESQTDRGNLDIAWRALNCDPATVVVPQNLIGARSRYRLRKQTVEPVCGAIKQRIRF